jgi:hypothetical protein
VDKNITNFFSFKKKETHKNYLVLLKNMEDKRSIPVCFKPDEIKLIENYAKRFGMTNYSQAIEKLASDLKKI